MAESTLVKGAVSADMFGLRGGLLDLYVEVKVKRYQVISRSSRKMMKAMLLID